MQNSIYYPALPLSEFSIAHTTYEAWGEPQQIPLPLSDEKDESLWRDAPKIFMSNPV
jgi:hypothetical protein